MVWVLMWVWIAGGSLEKFACWTSASRRWLLAMLSTLPLASIWPPRFIMPALAVLTTRHLTAAAGAAAGAPAGFSTPSVCVGSGGRADPGGGAAAVFRLS